MYQGFPKAESRDCHLYIPIRPPARSASFRIASALRERRSENGVVFVNPLCEGDPLASYSPVIVDDICVDKTDAAGLYSLALDAACSICSYYGISVKEA